MIDCMVFNAAFNSISVIFRRSVQLSILSWSSFNQSLHTIFFPSHWLLSHITIVGTTDSGERGTESCRNDCHQSSQITLAEPGIEPTTSCSAMLPTELWGSALHRVTLPHD